MEKLIQVPILCLPNFSEEKAGPGIDLEKLGTSQQFKLSVEHKMTSDWRWHNYAAAIQERKTVMRLVR